MSKEYNAYEIHGISLVAAEKIKQALNDYIKKINTAVDSGSLEEMCKNYAAGENTKTTIKKLDTALKEHVKSYANYFQGYARAMDNIVNQYKKIDTNTDSLNSAVSKFSQRKS